MRSKPNKLYKEPMNQNRFFGKINKINKCIANMKKWSVEDTQINKIRNEKGDISIMLMKSAESLQSI
jgi:predicted ATPase